MVGAGDLQKIVLSQSTINGLYHSPEFLSDSGFFSVVFTARRTPGDVKTVLKFFVNPNNDPYRRLAFDREGALLWGQLRGEDRFVQLKDPPGALDLKVVAPGGATLTIQLSFLAFDWMNGGDADALAATPMQTYDDLLGRLDCFREMVRAVARLHHLNCFHRDLKPGNFLFENTPECRKVRLSDFGTIRFCDGSPPLAAEYRDPVGDLRYSAPELFSGVDIPQEWHRAADIYSLGAILFELLTGQQLIGFTFGSSNDALSFSQHMRAVSPGARLVRLNGFLDSHGHVLPNLRTINPFIPRCVAPYLEELLAALTEFDYRQRDIELTRVVRLLDICRIVVANEGRYLDRLRRRRAAGGTP